MDAIEVSNCELISAAKTQADKVAWIEEELAENGYTEAVDVNTVVTSLQRVTPELLARVTDESQLEKLMKGVADETWRSIAAIALFNGIKKAKPAPPTPAASSGQATRFPVRRYTVQGDRAVFSDKGMPSVMFAVQRTILSLQKWVVDCVSGKRMNGIMVINGYVKTGKTATMLNLLPQLIEEKTPEAKILRLDFNTFLIPGCSPDQAEQKLCAEVAAEAEKAGFQLSEADRTNLRCLMATLAWYPHGVYFLIDEVQRYFENGDEMPGYDIFKGFLQINDLNRKGGGLHFCLTGSAMVQAWIAFLSMSSNGYSFLGNADQIDMPMANSEQELEEMKSHLLTLAGEERATLEGLIEGLESVPMMAYVANAHDTRSVSATWDYVNTKIRSEFKADFLPLLAKMSDSDRIYIWQLASGLATKSPREFFKTDLFKHSFLSRTLVQNDGRFGLPNGTFATCVLDAVGAKGQLLRTPDLPIVDYRRKERLIPTFQNIGEKVKDFQLSDPRVTEITNTIMAHLGQYRGSFDIDKAIKELKKLSNRKFGQGKKGESKPITFLKKFRNAAAHLKASDRVRLRKLVDLLPARPTQLAEDLKGCL